ncbi:MAG: hypothetical protein M9938_09350 [Solirubrobacterales bacterium]|nr:hypothetical protein [Solirubrobacterales bacterium]
MGLAPARYYAGVLVSIVLAGLAAWSAAASGPLFEHLWLVAGLILLTGLTVILAPFYHRWYRHMRRADADDRAITEKYGPPAPEEVWSGGIPDLPPLDRDGPKGEGSEKRERPSSANRGQGQSGD